MFLRFALSSLAARLEAPGIACKGNLREVDSTGKDQIIVFAAKLVRGAILAALRSLPAVLPEPFSETGLYGEGLQT